MREFGLKFHETPRGWSWYTLSGDTDYPDCYGGGGNTDPGPLEDEIGRAITGLLQTVAGKGVFLAVQPDGTLTGYRREVPEGTIITPELVRPLIYMGLRECGSCRGTGSDAPGRMCWECDGDGEVWT